MAVPPRIQNMEGVVLNRNIMTRRRELERPTWTSNGTLVKRCLRRHYIPKHPFYYTAKELYETDKSKPPESMPANDVKNYLNNLAEEKGDQRRAFSAPQQQNADVHEKKVLSPASPKPPQSQPSCRKSLPSEQLRKEERAKDHSAPSSGKRKESLPVLKPGSYQKLFPEAVPWSITHVPGVRVLQEHDHYRREALNMKNSLLYRMDSGMLPRYMGYVPGLKFRHGGRFYTLTYNAKEIGMKISPTWGGAVSLL